MATKRNIVIDQGTTFSNNFPLLDVNGDDLNTTNCTAAAMMRKSFAASNSVSFTVSLSNGSCVISLSANQTSNIVAGRYVYDVELNNGGVITRVVEGLVTIKPEVTR